MTDQAIAAGTRLTIDHLAGGHARETAARDDAGRVVLRVKGDWAILDDQGRWTLYNTPELLSTAKRSLIDGLIGGLIGGPTNTPSVLGRNPGPGRQTVRRALLPAKGPSPRPEALASVDRAPTEPGEPAEFQVTWASGIQAAMTFVPVPAPAETAATTGFADPRYATYELRYADRRPVIRHTARIGTDRNLEASAFEVLDPQFPLDQAVVLCLARFHAWRA